MMKSIFLGGFDNTSRVTRYDNTGRNVALDHATGTHNGVIADSGAGQNDGTSSDKTIIAYFNLTAFRREFTLNKLCDNSLEHVNNALFNFFKKEVKARSK